MVSRLYDLAYGLYGAATRSLRIDPLGISLAGVLLCIERDGEG